MTATATPILQIKVSLVGIRPPIWRRLLVHKDTPLSDLHLTIQDAMGWANYHMHMFIKDGQIYQPVSENELDIDNEGEDEALFTLGSLLPRVKSKFRYIYDFGDDWMHEVLLEDRLAAEARQYPTCIKGRRACPPEDCGGVWGYESLLDVLKDPEHPRYTEMREWAGEDFDPEYFDLEDINRRLTG